jgi:chaperonin GroEL
MERVGNLGVINVTEGKTLVNEVEVIEGMKFDQGYLSRYFVTDPKENKGIFDNAHVLLFANKISSAHAILPLLDQVARSNKKLVIVAENIEGEALATLIVNRLRGMNIAAVKAPGFGDNRTQMMGDIAALVGSRVISEEIGDKLEEITLEDLGFAKRIELTQNDTVILDGQGSKESIQERCDLIKSALEKTTSEYEREKLQERLAKLSGGVALIKVGGASEVEVSEKKDRIVDALNATRAAVEEGIVPGGGVALLYASRDLSSLKTNNVDRNQGIDIIRAALKVSFHYHCFCFCFCFCFSCSHCMLTLTWCC